MGQYDFTIRGCFYMMTCYDVYNKREARDVIHKMYPRSKITSLSEKITDGYK
jgi:hypothetical protein